MRLQSQGLLEAGWQPSDQSGKPPRHTYRLTGEGLKLARQRLAAATKRRAVSAPIARQA
jgi:DNA-binding PadR family transcriptional regulator